MIEFHPSQSLVVSDTHRFRVVCAGRRFGKSTLSAWEMLGCAVQAPDKRVVYIAPTVQQARDIVWAELKKICGPITVDTNETRLEIKVRTTQGGTSLIVLRGWEAVETLRGQKFHLLVLDEVASMRNFWEGWQEVLRPALTDYRGEVLFISTPKGFNHFYDLYRMEAKDNDFKSFHFTSYDNPYLPKEEIDKAQLELTEDRFAQEYMADFRKTEGLVYKEFDRTRHVISPLQLPPHYSEVIAGADFGFTHPAAVMSIGKDHDGRYYVFAEWVHRGKTDAEIAEYIAAQKFQRVYPDPENPAAIEELRRRGVNLREVKKGKGSVVGGINVVRELFKSNRLFISSECVSLILELETYSYADSKGAQDPNESPKKENDDACFVEGSSILTLDGNKDIKDVKSGDIIWSGFSWTKVIDSFFTGEKNTIKIRFNSGVEIEGTSDHPVLKQQLGLTQIGTLKYNDHIWVNKERKTEKKFGLMGNYIVDTQMHQSHLQDLSIFYVTRQRFYCIAQCMNIFLVKFLVTLTYITLIIIELITMFLIFLASKKVNTQENINKRKKYSRIFVNFAIKYFSQKQIESGGYLRFAMVTAELISIIKQRSILKIGLALFAEKIILLVETPKLQLAMENVVSYQAGEGKRKVYNLSTEFGMYTVNGVIVSNCDAIRYPLMMDASQSTRRSAEITFGNQKHYGGDEYAGVIEGEQYTAHRYETL